MPHSALLYPEPLLTSTSAGDPQTLKGRSCSVSVGSPGVHKVLFVSSKSLFPWSCVSSGGSMVGLTVTSSKRVYGIPRSAALRGPATAVGHYRAVPPEETLKQFWLCLCGVSGSWYAQGVYEPSEHLWWVCDLILNAIFPHLPSY